VQIVLTCHLVVLGTCRSLSACNPALEVSKFMNGVEKDSTLSFVGTLVVWPNLGKNRVSCVLQCGVIYSSSSQIYSAVFITYISEQFLLSSQLNM
jgi:hypothetical protein